MRIAVNGIELNCTVEGPTAAPWLTFSHSLGCSGAMWQPQVDAFRSRYRVLTYDIRGHGSSDAPAGPYSIDTLVEDARALLLALDIRRTHFVGLSLGGMIGQHLAARHPGLLDHLVLADTVHVLDATARLQWEERIRLVSRGGMEAIVGPTLERWFTPHTRAARSDTTAPIERLLRSTPVAGYLGCCHAILGMDSTAMLPAIRAPTTVVAGEHDAVAGSSAFIASQIPGARFVSIAAAGHLPNIEQASSFNDALDAFLGGR